MIKRKIMITLAATVAAMTLVTGCGKKTTSMSEISGEDLVQVTKDSDENETSGDKALPTTTKETEKSTKESASEEKEAETSSGTDETDIKPAETSEKTDAKPAQSHTSKPAVNEQQTKPAANTPEKSDTKPVQKPSQTVTQPATKASAEPATTPAATPVTKPTEPQKPKVKTMWDAPYDVEGIKAYIIKEMKAKGYTYADEYWKAIIGDEFEGYTPDDCAWDNYCTTTAGPQRYYDKVNKCAVGHQHYKWSEPFNGSIAENAEASTEWMVNHAIDYWDEIYGKEYSYKKFSVYVESFDDGCVIFYILAM